MTAHPVSKHDRRAALETPYAHEHERSLERRMGKGAQPKGFEALIGWFREVIADEPPFSVHRSGVFFGTPDQDVTSALVGGSRIGSPAIRDEFRRFIEGVPWQTDADGYFRLPFRAALSRLHRRFPLTARALFQLALLGGDWHRLGDQMCYPQEVIAVYLDRALYHLWTEYTELRRVA